MKWETRKDGIEVTIMTTRVTREEYDKITSYSVHGERPSATFLRLAIERIQQIEAEKRRLAEKFPDLAESYAAVQPAIQRESEIKKEQ